MKVQYGSSDGPWKTNALIFIVQRTHLRVIFRYEVLVVAQLYVVCALSSMLERR